MRNNTTLPGVVATEARSPAGPGTRLMAAIWIVFKPGLRVAGIWAYGGGGAVHPPVAVPIGTPLRNIVALESTITLIITS